MCASFMIENMLFMIIQKLMLLFSEIVAGSVAASDICSPKITSVEIPKDEDPNVAFFPSCVAMPQCGGCGCGHAMLECAAVEERMTAVQVGVMCRCMQRTTVAYARTSIFFSFLLHLFFSFTPLHSQHSTLSEPISPAEGVGSYLGRRRSIASADVTNASHKCLTRLY